jgi:hypothetical protein
MSRLKDIPPKDLERISLYLDGELPADAVRAFEKRLASDPDLRQAVAEMREVVGAVRGLKEVRVPRNFTLTEAMVGRSRRPAYPYLRFATALATALFILVSGLRLAPSGLRSMAASAPAPEAAMQSQDFALESGAQAPAEEEPSPAPNAETGLRAAIPTLAAAAPAPTPSPVGTACAACPSAGAVAAAPPTGTAVAEQPVASGEAPSLAAKSRASPWAESLPAIQAGLGLVAVLLLLFTVQARRR